MSDRADERRRASGWTVVLVAMGFAGLMGFLIYYLIKSSQV